MECVRLARINTGSCAMPMPLCDQPETGNREVVIERERKPNARAFHDGEAGRVHGRQLVQVRAPKIFPRLLQIAQLAGKDLDGSRLVDRTLLRQGHVPVGIALKKGECLNDHGNGGVKLRTGTLQNFPLVPRLRVQRIPRERKRDPRSAVDESGLALPHQGSL